MAEKKEKVCGMVLCRCCDYCGVTLSMEEVTDARLVLVCPVCGQIYIFKRK